MTNNSFLVQTLHLSPQAFSWNRNIMCYLSMTLTEAMVKWSFGLKTNWKMVNEVHVMMLLCSQKS